MTGASLAPVYLDEMGHLWSADRETLHALAEQIGVRRAWFQERPVLYHYDLMAESKRRLARQAGAQSITARELVGLMRAGSAAEGAG